MGPAQRSGCMLAGLMTLLASFHLTPVTALRWQDAVWDKACCAPMQNGEATTCVRQSPMKWMCELESMVNTKAFAKSVRKVKLPAHPCQAQPFYHFVANSRAYIHAERVLAILVASLAPLSTGKPCILRPQTPCWVV